jgi:hypothetical protein
MRWNCKTIWLVEFGLLAAVLLNACRRVEDSQKVPVSSAFFETKNYQTNYEGISDEDRETLLLSLERIAEQERSGAFIQGLAIQESVIRENLGDLAGAVAAAYKELTWAYGMGLLQKEELEQGLNNALALGNLPSQAARGILFFINGNWTAADSILRSMLDGAEPDSCIQWMILCCALEQDRNDRRSAAAYRAIRARYEKFPEYWYRGARAFPAVIAAEYAEHCIALAPSGPFAGECRRILASCIGLNPGDGSILLSRSEIESLITMSVNQGDPALLSTLMPLVSLPDNSYTVYATGALRALSAIPKFREYFRELANRSSGRLSERLGYICRSGL